MAPTTALHGNQFSQGDSHWKNARVTVTASDPERLTRRNEVRASPRVFASWGHGSYIAKTAPAHDKGTLRSGGGNQAYGDILREFLEKHRHGSASHHVANNIFSFAAYCLSQNTWYILYARED